MTIQLSDRCNRIKPSPTLAVTAKANELKAQGLDVIGLGAGEPDFDTPDHIKAAANEAIQSGFTRYTAVDGIPELKDAIIDKFAKDNQLKYEQDQILVSVGGKQSFFNLTQALLNDGDEVIVPAPYWVSYPDMVALAGGNPVIIETDIQQHFKITAEQLENAITPKTRLVVLNSPSNPTGVAYQEAELKALGDVLLKHPHVLVATDDMYEHILFPGNSFSNILMATPELYDRTIVLNGVSKAYSMTGWRIGYAGGPKTLIGAMKKIQSQSTSNPTSISQKAAVAALAGDQTCVDNMVKAFKERHDFVLSSLNALPGVQALPSDGTFYAFPNVQGLLDANDAFSTDTELATYLLEKAQVALVPGSAFGAPGYIRLSFAASMETLTEALKRIKDAIQQ